MTTHKQILKDLLDAYNDADDDMMFHDAIEAATAAYQAIEKDDDKEMISAIRLVKEIGKDHGYPVSDGAAKRAIQSLKDDGYDISHQEWYYKMKEYWL